MSKASSDSNETEKTENSAQHVIGDSNFTTVHNNDTMLVVNDNDIGIFVNAEKLHIDDIKNLLKNIWVPGEKYEFPWIYNNNDKRKFQRIWLEKFKFLSYSAVPGKEGAFCRYCVLMGKLSGGRGDQGLKKLVKEPFTSYKKALEYFRDHQVNKYHIVAQEQVNHLQSNSLSIDEMLCTQVKESNEKMRVEEREYRRRLRYMIETVQTLAQQELALRGRRDAGPLDLDSTPVRGNESNVKALLRYRAIGDKQLYKDIQNAPKNMMLTSPDIQNQIIQLCGDAIKESLLADIKKSGIYSIIADCTADVSRKEQLSLAIRYVTTDGDMKEDMVCLLSPTATTGSALARDLTDAITQMGLPLSNCRGQAYDGSANMSGHMNGVQALIKQDYPLAIYTHCQSHKLNLALARALSVPGIKQMLATLSQVSDFISGSPGRVSLLEKNVEECIPESRKKRVKPLCRVRWVEQHDSVLTFSKLLKPIVMTLEDIIEQGNNKAVSKADGYLAVMTQFQFIVSLEMAVILFDITKPLSVKLQRPNQTFGKSMMLVKDVIEEVESSKERFNVVMEKATKLANELDVAILIPRGRTGKKLDNTDPADFYRTQRWEPFISEMVNQLKIRFPEDHPAFQLQEVLPPHIVEIESKAIENKFDSIIQAAEVYEEDLPCIDSLRSELHLWRRKMSKEKPKDPDHGYQMKEVFKMTNDFPNIRAIVTLLMTIPATSCTAERAFSTLKRVKTPLRSRMGEERLEALMLISMFGHERLSVDRLLDAFVNLKPRRFQKISK